MRNLGIVLALLTCACATTGPAVPAAGPQAAAAAPVVAAPARLALDAEASALLHSGALGFAPAASVAIEADGCCKLGAYVTYTKLADPGLHIDNNRASNPTDKVLDIVDGGLELGAIFPCRFFELRLRAGMAGTPPAGETLGRRGFSVSFAAAARLGAPVGIGEFRPRLAAVAGIACWSFRDQVTSAGLDGSAASGCAAQIGLRLGAAYGLELR